ncbi:MAG: 2-C-methyl-D-erythritol 4-phosphate cytidylyltransferase [Mycoplasmoidaceae bacterium]|nr:2-C-methyl-D-erythritol 4-phosphate cytidylyltransferase [Mycoplasmoidaceae bacterium]
MANYAIILAAGDGKRLGSTIPKCFIKINKTPIYQFSLDTFCQISDIKKIILVVPKQYKNKVKNNCQKVEIITGGSTRNKSFENAMKALSTLSDNDKILIHDAARINVLKKDIVRLIKSRAHFGTLCFSGPKNDADFRINKYNIQTPQFCKYSIYKQTLKPNKLGKDLFSYLNLKPTKENFIISTNKKQNFKITVAADLAKTKTL